MKKYITLLIFVFISLNIQIFGENAAIDTTETINVGGIKQVISLKGKDVNKPILLYLHGGGGSSSSIISKADQLTSKLQEHFVVVLWDQRGYGKTYALNQSPQPITVKLMVNDTKEVIDYLLKKFDRKKLYLVGHSMGSMLGIHIAHSFPEVLYALIEMSPPVNSTESSKIALNKLKKHFKKVNNQRAIRELATVKVPTTDFEQQFIQYVWQTEFDGEHVTDEMRDQGKPLLKKATETMGSYFNEVSAMNFFKLFPSLNCPVYFFTGRKDLTTNSTITEKFYKKVKAPKKGFFWFEKSAHNLPDMESDLMQEIIINKILPETY